MNRLEWMAGSYAGLALELELSKLQTSPHWLDMEVPVIPQPRYLHPSTQSYRSSSPLQRGRKN